MNTYYKGIEEFNTLVFMGISRIPKCHIIQFIKEIRIFTKGK